MKQQQENWKKAEQMLLYFAQKSKRDRTFGKVKLAKLMFYADFHAYRLLGKSITGLEYKKYPQGPIPTKAKAIQEHLVEAGELEERTVPVGWHERKQLVPTTRFNRKSFFDVFSETELGIMDWVWDQIRPMKAVDVSDLSHEFLGWQVAKMYEVIPYGTMLIDRRPLKQEEIEYGKQLIQQMGRQG